MSSQQRIRQPSSSKYNLEDSALGPMHKRGDHDLEESKEDPMTAERDYRGIA